MTSMIRKVAAVTAAAALSVTGAAGAANAQTGNLNLEDIPVEELIGFAQLSVEILGESGFLEDGSSGGGSGLGSGSGSGVGSLGLEPAANAGGNGSIDTSGSLWGEPTSGSMSGLLVAAVKLSGVNSSSPRSGSVDTANSSLGEPTSG